ncbi:hypothetical protein MPER_03556, partial [Moniliophthora perniciosa FA553]
PYYSHIWASNTAESEVFSVVKSWPDITPNLDLCSDEFNLSPKVVKLVQLLKSCQHYGKSFKGIIFVRRRIVALALTALIKALGMATRSLEDLEIPKVKVLI